LFLQGGTVRGDEARVVAAFERWLTEAGWTVRTEVDFADVFAQRGEERLHAEAKGRTAAPGLDIDTLYGQLLRRMPPDEVGSARFAVVVPAEAVPHAQRVNARVRQLLDIDIYSVDLENQVTLVA